MTTIPFFKYHGLGNDFLLVDAIDRPALASLAWNDIAVPACHRRTGIGADGVLILTAPPDPALADVRMTIINSDGSHGHMCGNGIRCIARYMADHRGWRPSTLRVQTPAGVLPVALDLSSGLFTVNMGSPRLDSAAIPVNSTLPQILDIPLDQLPGADAAWNSIAAALAPLAASPVRLSCVSMGNPHAVFFLNDISSVALETLGPAIEHHPFFPQRTNVHLVRVLSPSLAEMRTWERGAGITLACGTGACAVLVAAVLTGRLHDAATLRLPGGELSMSWQRGPAADRPVGVYKSGPAAEVFSGTFSAGLASPSTPSDASA